jgi:hypothetical protein
MRAPALSVRGELCRLLHEYFWHAAKGRLEAFKKETSWPTG